MMARTIYLARLMGLFLILAALSMFLQSRLFVETEDAFVHERPLLWLAGLIFLACGLAIVLAHNRWSGGLLPVVVTILGWTALIKGVLILFLSPEMLIHLFELLHPGAMIFIYAAIGLVVGIYLTWAGFRGPAER